jgi:hypothetical protein
MNTTERNQLQDELVEVILESMGTKEVLQFAREKMHDTFDYHSYEELLVVADDYGIEVDIPEEVEL